jgi:hypothetical protein
MSVAAPPSVPPRRRPAPPPDRTVQLPARVAPRHVSRPVRRLVFAVALLLLVALIPVLAYFGARAALDTGQGAESTAADPDAPGYQALVTPTPTTLAVEVAPDGTLNGATLVASSGDGKGGSVLFIPGTLLVAPDTPSSRTLVDVEAAGGTSATADVLRQLFHIGFDQVVTIDPAQWAHLVDPVAPLRFENSDELTRSVAGAGEQVAFRAGPLALGSGDVGEYLTLRNEGEDEAAYLYRHELFWRAWLSAIAARGDASAVPGEVGSGVGAAVRTLALGAVRYVTLPVEAVESLTRDQPDFRVDTDRLASTLADVVPFPSSGQPGDRVKVRLLDGTGDRARSLAAAALLVPAGAEIAIFGTAEQLDHATTVVRYYNPARRAGAEALAAALGSAGPELQETQTDTVDVTVIVGRDFEGAGT